MNKNKTKIKVLKDQSQFDDQKDIFDKLSSLL